MMKKYSLVIIAVFLFLPGLGICEAGDWTGNINLYHGIKNHSALNDWDYSDYALEYGLFIDFRKRDWFVNFAVDYLRSYYDEYVETQELNIGLRKVFGDPIEWAPYIGGGITLLDASVDYKGYSDNDTGTGVWADIGWYWNFFEHLNFAWEFRFSSTEVTLLGSKGDVGGWKTGIILGYHF
jgi:hypothetical protein